MIENKKESFEISDENLALLSAGLNEEQIRSIKETKNVVVSAGAGSGKTTVLASRYAYLVEAKNIPCEKILTLTFTKKAANEMKERIFNGLRFHFQGKDVKGKKNLPEDFENLDRIRSRARKAVESFDKTHIQTLDSYFSEIAKKASRYYGINPNFTLDDDKIVSLVNYRATKYVLEHLEEKQIKEIAEVFQIQNVASDLFAAAVLNHSTVLTPIDFDKSLQIQKLQIIKEYKKVTAQITDEIASYILLPQNPKPSATMQNLYLYISEVGNPESPVLSEQCFESQKNAEFFLNRFFNYCKDVSGFCASAFSRGDNQYKVLKANLFPLLEKLYLLANSISGFNLTKEIFSHLSVFQEEMAYAKRTSGLLSFSDVSELALTALKEQDEIRHTEQQKFDAIMIDEFQDDNSLQCDVLLILSDLNEKYENGIYRAPKLADADLLSRLDSHKLFFVGDDKQSIYRFRGADVSVFRSLSASIKNEIQLKTNYRSEPELIEGFNTLFGGYNYPDGETVNDLLPAIFMTEEKFPPKPDGTEQIPEYEADYKKVEVPEFKIKPSTYSTKKVTLAFYPKKGDDTDEEVERNAYECEASYVAREIKKLLSLKDENGNQKYHYRDIALLFRSAGPTSEYENVLLSAGIPYSTEVYKGFFSDGPINDIMSLLKLCVYPEDKNAYAKLLRSPFCSLTFSELEKILVNTENPYKTPFSSEMLGLISEDKELSEKIINLKTIYEDIKSRLRTEKLTKTISYIWYELGYRYETLWNKSVSLYSSFYDILFEMARIAESKTQSLASFIDMVKSYEDSDKKLDGLDVILDAEDAVQILTVHKSKGLEFKVVFVCAVSCPSNPSSPKTALSDEYGFLLKTPVWKDYQTAAESLALSSSIRKDLCNTSYCMNKIDVENKKQELAELKRLAYVAFTRAEEELYIVGSEKKEFDDEKALEKYNSPKNMYQLLIPVLFDSNTENGPQNPVFNFINDFEAFKSIKAENSESLEKSDFIKNLPDLQETEIIQEKLSPKLYVSPSKLKVHSGENPSLMKADSVNPDYELINKIVASSIPSGVEEIPLLSDNGEESENQSVLSPSMSPLFTFANFGTIAHAYMEGKVLCEDAKIGTREWIGMNERFIPKINMEKWNGETNREKKISKIKELCEDMAKRFESSTIYNEVRLSSWKKTEYSFRAVVDKLFASEETSDLADELILTGQIDLVYKNPENSKYKYTIVDYKTNQTIEPELYYSQLSCYRKAVSQMLSCSESEIRCVLYYLRFAKEVEVNIG